MIGLKSTTRELHCANCDTGLTATAGTVMTCGICGAPLCENCWFNAPMIYRPTLAEEPSFFGGSVRLCKHCAALQEKRNIIDPTKYIGD